MGRKPRKHYTPAEKVAILRRHLVEKVPVSDLCDEFELSPNVFYAWQKTFFENGAAAFERSGAPRQVSAELKKIEKLEAKLQRKDEVMAELLTEHILLKKNLGEN